MKRGVSAVAYGARAAGFDLFNLPLMDPETFDSALARKSLDDSGLLMIASLGLTSGTGISSTDPNAVAAGPDRYRRNVWNDASDLAAHANAYNCAGDQDYFASLMRHSPME